jgi:predicted metal-dependent peptidase
MDNHMHKTAKVILGLAEKNLLSRCPFYARIINYWRKLPFQQDTISVAAVGEAIHLLYNPDFVCGLEIDSLTAVLEHELYHVLFGHIFLDKSLFDNQTALLIACEVTANEYVFDQKKLPGEPLFLVDWGLPPKESTMARYHSLCLDSKCIENEVTSLDSHTDWGNGASSKEPEKILRDQIKKVFESTTPEEIMALPKKVRNSIKEIVGAGNMPGGQQERLSNANKAHLPWISLLQLYMNLFRKYTFSWPSRRLPHLLGIVPGHRLAQKKPSILVAIDTSGSMDIAVVDCIRAELDHIARLSKVILVECDTTITRIYTDFKPGQLNEITGRGGTDLCPPFELLNQYKVDLLIYFTDGEGSAPVHSPDVPVIWCITHNGKPPVPWGRVIQMNDR